MNHPMTRVASCLALLLLLIGACPAADARAILGTPTDEDARIILGTPTVIEVLCSMQQPLVSTLHADVCTTLGTLSAPVLEDRCFEALLPVSVEGGDMTVSDLSTLLTPLAACL